MGSETRRGGGPVAGAGRSTPCAQSVARSSASRSEASAGVAAGRVVVRGEASDDGLTRQVVCDQGAHGPVRAGLDDDHGLRGAQGLHGAGELDRLEEVADPVVGVQRLGVAEAPAGHARDDGDARRVQCHSARLGT